MSAKQRCLHGMILGTCATCTPPRIANVPKHRPEARVHHEGVVRPDDHDGFVVVDTRGGQKRADVSMATVDASTTMVHMLGSVAYLWAFEEVLRRAPNLKVIQVLPAMTRHLSDDSHRRICRERGVEIRAGHVRPNGVWKEGRITAPHYEAQRRFMAGLAGPQKDLFEELLTLGFDCAAMAKIYFLLDGGDVTTQSKIAADFGFDASRNAYVSEMIASVLYYLDNTVQVGDGAIRRARAVRARVNRLRPYIASGAARQRLIDSLGVQTIATEFPLARAETFKALVTATRDGRFEAFRQQDPRGAEAVSLRFGLDALDRGVYRVLSAVGDALGGLSAERARQLEERALAALNIVEDDDAR